MMLSVPLANSNEKWITFSVGQQYLLGNLQNMTFRRMCDRIELFLCFKGYRLSGLIESLSIKNCKDNMININSTECIKANFALPFDTIRIQNVAATPFFNLTVDDDEGDLTLTQSINEIRNLLIGEANYWFSRKDSSTADHIAHYEVALGMLSLFVQER